MTDFWEAKYHALAAAAREIGQQNKRIEKVRAKDLQRIKQLVFDGLKTDGGHHKQWFLEQIGEMIGMKINKTGIVP